MSTKICTSCTENMGDYCDYGQQGYPHMIKCTGYVEKKTSVILLPTKPKEKPLPTEFYHHSKEKEKKCLYYAKLPN